ncbi:hypothetical protein IKS57_02165 [bacterium]|nr:hypothetical protein [bacterium]
MVKIHDKIKYYIHHLKCYNTNIIEKINNDFNTLKDYKTINDIIDKNCIKYNENEIHKINVFNTSDDLKDLLTELIKLIPATSIKYYNLKIDDLKQMCIDYYNFEKLFDMYKLEDYSDYYSPLLIYFKLKSSSLKPKRNLYIDLLIKELYRHIKINDKDNIHDLIIKMNTRYLPYLDDLIKFYKLLNKDDYHE